MTETWEEKLTRQLAEMSKTIGFKYLQDIVDDLSLLCWINPGLLVGIQHQFNRKRLLLTLHDVKRQNLAGLYISYKLLEDVHYMKIMAEKVGDQFKRQLIELRGYKT